MEKHEIEKEPAVEVVDFAYKGSFWKFFGAFTVIITLVLTVYLGFIAPHKSSGNETISANSANSFLNSLGNAVKGTFAGPSDENLVEVVNVNSSSSKRIDRVEGESSEVNSSNDDGLIDKGAEEVLSVSDSPDSEIDKSVSKKETPTTLCSFTTNQTSSKDRVIINEVDWMGTLNSSNDEWIELKNISDSVVDISGWQVVDKAEQIQVVINGVIPSGGFYLLERSDDSSVPDVSANVIYSGALSNTDEGLRLFDNNCNLIDEVFANPDWPAGNSSSRRAMQREGNLSWSTFGGNSNGSILGTPMAENGIALVSVEESSAIPEENVTITTPSPNSASERININTANLEELQRITGIGPAYAQRIIDYRETNGSFQAIEEIKNVKGIGDVTFEKMKDQITV